MIVSNKSVLYHSVTENNRTDNGRENGRDNKRKNRGDGRIDENRKRQ